MSEDQAPSTTSDQTTEVTDLDTFVNLLAGWHQKRVKRLEEVLQTPAGTEVTLNDGPPFILEGDALKGFQIGISLALSQLGTLPFSAEIESLPDAPVH